MKIDTTWLLFGVVAGGMGVALIALGSLLSGFLMCSGVLGWLFVANNTGQLFIEEDDEEDLLNDTNGSSGNRPFNKSNSPVKGAMRSVPLISLL